jgi:hypothetical protein
LKTTNLLAFSAVGGILLTLVTGLFRNTPEMLVGAVWYGYPLAWLVRQLGNPAYPTMYVLRPVGLAVDIVSWLIIVAVILFAYTMARRRE